VGRPLWVLLGRAVPPRPRRSSQGAEGAPPPTGDLSALDAENAAASLRPAEAMGHRPTLVHTCKRGGRRGGALVLTMRAASARKGRCMCLHIPPNDMLARQPTARQPPSRTHLVQRQVVDGADDLGHVLLHQAPAPQGGRERAAGGGWAAGQLGAPVPETCTPTLAPPPQGASPAQACLTCTAG
jgi:hypothetical protein